MTSNLTDLVSGTIGNYFDSLVLPEDRDDSDVWRQDMASEVMLSVREAVADRDHYVCCEADFEYGVGQVSPCRCEDIREILKVELQ